MSNATVSTTTSDSKAAYDPEYQKRLRIYYIQCLLSEGSKIVLFSIFFLICHLFREFLAALFFLMLLRTNGGGIHCKHYVSCLMLSFAVLTGSIVLAIEVPAAGPVMGAAILASAVLGYLLVPITSANRPPASDVVIQKSKRNTVVILLVCFILVCIVPNSLYIRIGFWTIVIHIMQLLIAKFLKRRNA